MNSAKRDPFATAYLAISEWLAAERWQAGDKLNLVAIAQELRLSPTPVREAVSRLVGEELVEYRRAQGYFVPHLLVSEIEDLWWLLEGLVLHAVARLDDRSLSAAVRASLPNMDDVAHALLLACESGIANRIVKHARARLGSLERLSTEKGSNVTIGMSESRPLLRAPSSDTSQVEGGGRRSSCSARTRG